MLENAEHQRLKDADDKGVPWRRWGPYLSERQWGTVREDYSSNGDAWNYFSHDHARSRAYHWGEDGLAGISDDKQRLCFALALWNGADPILKERLFGLTNSEGNHGEDVKEYYYYLDSTPTHSYMKWLYKYPRNAYPYRDLIETNRRRNRNELEYELIDTGVFNDDRYFDVFVRYAKDSPEDLLIEITAENRGPEDAVLHLLPTLWFRNTWSWGEPEPRPELSRIDGQGGLGGIHARHPNYGEMFLYCEGAPPTFFTENETNMERVFGTPNGTPYVKDAFHRYLIEGRADAVNPAGTGTKACALYQLNIPAKAGRSVRLRLTRNTPRGMTGAVMLGQPFAETLAQREQEADLFYESITPESMNPDQAMVMRQALASTLWTKQYYFFDLDKWLEEHNSHPTVSRIYHDSRNSQWFHMVNDDVISMPDKWEYPWYAAWDLAFHTVALAMVDLPFAKQQLDLMLRDVYLHPNGQLPAYEWNFGDVNPPVHAWATLFLYALEKESTGKGDVEFLAGSFQKLLLNFTWWVNRKDRAGRNVFEGGFLGLDNIAIFDRSSPLPTGGYLEQADGTAWMAFFCQSMLEIAIELAYNDRAYEGIATKFIEHFYWIAAAMDHVGDCQDEMWDERDGFFYDLLRLPSGSCERLKVRSMVGLLPLCATTVLPADVAARLPNAAERARSFLRRHPELAANLTPPFQAGAQGRHLLAIFNENKLRRVLKYMLDENEFLSPYGIRSLSKYHENHPFVMRVHGDEYRVGYLPAESDTGMFGGNSNWRGPIWFPVNALIIRALVQSYLYYGNDFTIECPTGSGRMMTLFEVAREISRRLLKIFLLDEQGRRPVFGEVQKFQNDPNWRDNLNFYEYFHGDNGAGIGASHQTGWTSLVARFMQMFGTLDPAELLHGQVTRPVTKAFRREAAVARDARVV